MAQATGGGANAAARNVISSAPFVGVDTASNIANTYITIQRNYNCVAVNGIDLLGYQIGIRLASSDSTAIDSDLQPTALEGSLQSAPADNSEVPQFIHLFRSFSYFTISFPLITPHCCDTRLFLIC